MKQTLSNVFFICLFTTSLMNCSSSSSSNSTATVEVEQSAAAVGALLSGFGSANQSLNLRFTLDPSMEICNGLGRGPDKIIMTGRSGGDPRPIGSQSNSVTIDPDTDLCQNTSGEDNTGEASVGGPLFAQFVLAEEITGDCGGTEISLTKAFGYSRNVDGPQTEIYGRFEIDGQILNCTFIIDGNTGELSTSESSCSTDEGTSVTLASSTTCTLDGDIDRIALPTAIEGHYAVSTDETNTVAYDCSNFRNQSEGDDHISTITRDCSSFDAFGFNLTSFNIGFIVSGDASEWQIYRSATPDDTNNRLKMMRNAGYPILVSIDMLYVENYDPNDPSSVADGESFPEDLLDNGDFQQELREEIVEIASEMEDLNVEIFCPMSEPDRIFGSSSDATAFLQSITSELESRFSGALMWIGFAVEDVENYNLTGYEYVAANISPMPSHTTSTAFQTHVTESLASLSTLAAEYNIPFLISNAGIWGEAIGNSYDWGTDAHAVEAFEIMYDESVAAGASGIIFWEGATGEVVFGSYPDVASYITTLFNP